MDGKIGQEHAYEVACVDLYESTQAHISHFLHHCVMNN
jgi:hypothetical protein